MGTLKLVLLLVVITLGQVHSWGWRGTSPDTKTTGVAGTLKKMFPWFFIVGADVASELLLKNPPPTVRPQLPIVVPAPTEAPNQLFDSNVSIGEGILALALCICLIAGLLARHFRLCRKTKKCGPEMTLNPFTHRNLTRAEASA